MRKNNKSKRRNKWRQRMTLPEQQRRAANEGRRLVRCEGFIKGCGKLYEVDSIVRIDTQQARVICPYCQNERLIQGYGSVRKVKKRAKK